jgi:hypothetical protein
LIERLSASMRGERSTSVIATCFFMCEALLPPPLPNSSSVFGRRLSAFVNVLR